MEPTETRSRDGKLVLPDGDLAPATLATLIDIVTFARKRLIARDTSPEGQVHEFRKAMRRARSLLRILRPSLSKRARRHVERPIANAHRALSASRDATMRVATWEGFAERHGFAVEPVHAALEALGESRPGLESANGQLFADVFAVLGDQLPEDMSSDDLRRGLQRTYKSARQSLRRVKTVADPVHVHALRRRIKDLTYQLELLTSLSPKRAAKWRARFSAQASALGEITDLYLLRDSLDRACKSAPTLLAPEQKRDIDRAIDRDVDHRLAESVPAVARLLSRKPRRFARRFGL